MFTPACRTPLSVPRLAAAAVAMAAVGGALPALAPDPAGAARSLTALQHLADTAGADVVVVRVAGLLVWLVWTWGALGLCLTAATALPGAAGALARGLLRVVVPAAGRRAAALALGAGIGLNGTVAVGTVLAGPALAAVPVSTPGVPDWPAAGPGTPSTPLAPSAPAVPDWPASPGSTSPPAHVVVRGDCLWRVAAAGLGAGGAHPSDAEVARAVGAWWTANRAVIGPDPDLLLPGQVLQAPAAGGPR